MTKESNEFERRVERINRLLAQEDAIVTWNDSIPDPDNPDQLRQIDITIRKNEEITHVECRLHRKTQDVKWVEELIGRRLSLQAHRMIAVSSSGFTKGAQAKADKYGIELRELNSLTDDEIRNWCYESKLTVDFYQYKETKVSFLFTSVNEGKVSIEKITEFARTSEQIKASLNFLFGKIKEELLKDDFKGENFELKRFVVFKEGSYKVDYVPIRAIIVTTKASFIRKDLNIYSILTYVEPETDKLSEKVIVETFLGGDFEVGRAINECYVTFDFSLIDIPENSQLAAITYDLGIPIMLQMYYTKGMERLNNLNIDFTDAEFTTGSYSMLESALTLNKLS